MTEKYTTYMSMEYRRNDVEGLCMTTQPIDENPVTVEEMKRLITKIVVQTTLEGKNCRRLLIAKLHYSDRQ
jgi:hypothetical protein